MNDVTKLAERVSVLEASLSRIESDIESEKGTRNRLATDFEARIRSLERTIWKGTGAIIAIQIAVGLLISLAK